MKKIFITSCCMAALVASAQNNAIFKGGSGDGHVSNTRTQLAANLFAGGSGDGHSTLGYSPSTASLWLGGGGDGWAQKNYAQQAISLYGGGAGDGHADSGYVQASMSFWKGGGGDGWANDTTFYNPEMTVPLTWLSFDAAKLGTKYSQLKWKTATENNTDRFDIERGYDGVHFAKINSVQASGYSSVIKNYVVVDSVPANGFNYYRIKQYDRNGKYSYSPARLVKFDQAATDALRMYPNPARNWVALEVPASIRYQNAVVNIIDMKGVVVSHTKLSAGSSSLVKLDLNKLPKAAYIVHISTANYSSSQTLLVQ